MKDESQRQQRAIDLEQTIRSLETIRDEQAREHSAVHANFVSLFQELDGSARTEVAMYRASGRKFHGIYAAMEQREQCRDELDMTDLEIARAKAQLAELTGDVPEGHAALARVKYLESQEELKPLWRSGRGRQAVDADEIRQRDLPHAQLWLTAAESERAAAEVVNDEERVRTASEETDRAKAMIASLENTAASVSQPRDRHVPVSPSISPTSSEPSEDTRVGARGLKDTRLSSVSTGDVPTCPRCGGIAFKPVRKTSTKVAFGFASLLGSAHHVECIACGTRYKRG